MESNHCAACGRATASTKITHRGVFCINCNSALYRAAPSLEPYEMGYRHGYKQLGKGLMEGQGEYEMGYRDGEGDRERIG